MVGRSGAHRSIKCSILVHLELYDGNVCSLVSPIPKSFIYSLYIFRWVIKKKIKVYQAYFCNEWWRTLGITEKAGYVANRLYY